MPEDFFNGQKGICRLPTVSPLMNSTTEAKLPNQTPDKTFGISASAAMPKDLPLWAERNRKIDALRLRYERQPSGLAKLARMFHSDADDEAIAARDLVTDLSISLQSSKTADIRRFAAESADLLSDFRTASAVFAACSVHAHPAGYRVTTLIVLLFVFVIVIEVVAVVVTLSWKGAARVIVRE